MDERDRQGADVKTASTAGSGPGAESGQVSEGDFGGTADIEAVLDESLGEFDGQMQREQEAMASAGQGSARGAIERESSDVTQVREAGAGGFGGIASTGMSDGADISMSGSGTISAPGGEGGQAGEQTQGTAGQAAGEGQHEVTHESTAGTASEPGQDGAPAIEIPDDIPANGDGDDQVARQIREAAMAESDPDIREALWDEYRRYTGIRKK